MIFYDFEVFKYDWLVVIIDPLNDREDVIHNDSDALQRFYEAHSGEIWVGFNNKRYDQYIFKGILCGLNPKQINDYIIVQGNEGYKFSELMRRIRMINYDVMTSVPAFVSLKALEGFMGSDIKETDVDFNISRPLTEEELQETIKYCRHDVEQTIEVFVQKIDNFHAMQGIIEAFPDETSVWNIGDSEARITAKVLGCIRQDWNDEFQWEYEDCLRISKYRGAVKWFQEKQEKMLGDLEWWDELEKSGQGKGPDRQTTIRDFYKQSLPLEVAGVPHTFGFGGLHGAPKDPVHYGPEDGAGYHVDVNNYYPSYLIAHDRVTRSATNDNYAKIYKTRKELKKKQQAAAAAGDKALAKEYKQKQLPYKKMLNALSGAMKDKTNPAYDPRMNNTMCINGQLMLLDLIEHLEAIPGFRLVQSNTDGLIIWLPDTDEAFQQMDDICYEWESRCSTDKCEIGLALDCIKEIYQKDVNNYLWIDADGGIEQCGDYVKPTNPIDNDLPIVRKAVVDRLSKGIPVEQTISQCDDMIMFQKIVKLSPLYQFVGWEHQQSLTKPPKRHRHRDGTEEIEYFYDEFQPFTYKCFRVFASKDKNDGRIMKCRGAKRAKFGNTPDHCFICNDNVQEMKVPEKLDRSYYIKVARERLGEFNVAENL